MTKLWLASIVLSVSACSSAPIKQQVSGHPICNGSKPAIKPTATFASYQGIQKGLKLNEVERHQTEFNKIADEVALRFFETLSDIKPAEGIRYQPLDQNDIHLIRVADKPLTFVICRQDVCGSLREPFSGKQIESHSQYFPNQGEVRLFSVASRYATSKWFYQSYRSDFATDPFSSAAQVVAYDLSNFIDTHYFEGQPEDRKPSSQLTNVSIVKKVQGNWKIQQVTLDPSEMCKHARPKTDLFSN